MEFIFYFQVPRWPRGTTFGGDGLGMSLYNIIFHLSNKA